MLKIAFFLFSSFILLSCKNTADKNQNQLVEKIKRTLLKHRDRFNPEQFNLNSKDLRYLHGRKYLECQGDYFPSNKGRVDLVFFQNKWWENGLKEVTNDSINCNAIVDIEVKNLQTLNWNSFPLKQCDKINLRVTTQLKLAAEIPLTSLSLQYKSMLKGLSHKLKGEMLHLIHRVAAERCPSIKRPLQQIKSLEEPMRSQALLDLISQPSLCDLDESITFAEAVTLQSQHYITHIAIPASTLMGKSVTSITNCKAN